MRTAEAAEKFTILICRVVIINISFYKFVYLIRDYVRGAIHATTLYNNLNIASHFFGWSQIRVLCGNRA